MKFFKLMFFGLFFLVACKENNSTISTSDVLVKVELARDTIILDNYVKGLVILEKPFFQEVESKIIVVFEEDEKFPLKNDLSNELEIPIVAFHNLSVDIENQEWFPDYDFNKTSAFGKKFSTTGSKKLRGFVLEYITEEPPSLDTIIHDDKHKKHYFEKEVYVKDTID